MTGKTNVLNFVEKGVYGLVAAAGMTLAMLHGLSARRPALPPVLTPYAKTVPVEVDESTKIDYIVGKAVRDLVDKCVLREDGEVVLRYVAALNKFLDARYESVVSDIEWAEKYGIKSALGTDKEFFKTAEERDRIKAIERALLQALGGTVKDDTEHTALSTVLQRYEDAKLCILLHKAVEGASLRVKMGPQLERLLSLDEESFESSITSIVDGRSGGKDIKDNVTSSFRITFLSLKGGGSETVNVSPETGVKAWRELRRAFDQMSRPEESLRR